MPQNSNFFELLSYEHPPKAALFVYGYAFAHIVSVKGFAAQQTFQEGRLSLRESEGCFYENPMEKAHRLPGRPTGGRRTFGAADTRQHGDLRGNREAAAGAARLAVPGGLDGAVCSDGNRVLSGADFRKAERACAVRIRCAAFAQLFLAIVLLQYAGVSVLVRLARAAVAAHSGCNRVVFPNFKAGGVPDDPLFTMGGVRGIFEPFDISAELR